MPRNTTSMAVSTSGFGSTPELTPGPSPIGRGGREPWGIVFETLAGAAAMAIIDADAHVLETEQTWSYMGESDQRYKPTLVVDPASGGKRAFWLIDGTVHVARRQGGADGTAGLHGDKVTL